MLKKLLKYDLKDMFKFLLVFYLIILFFSVSTRIIGIFNNSFFMNIVYSIFKGAMIAVSITIIINNIMRLWVRFRENMYKDESYLTHTLPISASNLYISKYLTAFITLFASIMVIVLNLGIAFYNKDLYLSLKNILLDFSNMIGTNAIIVLVGIFLALYLEFINFVLSGETGIILGHKCNNKKMALSVLFGFLYYQVTQVIVFVLSFLIPAIFNHDILKLFTGEELTNISGFKLIFIACIIGYLIINIFTCVLNVFILKKGVDVE